MSEKIKVICPNCSVANMLPSNVTKANCGKCKHDLLDNSPIILTDKNYDKFVNKSDLPILVDFWADWCMPCKMMAPFFKESSKEFSLKVKFGKLNTEHFNAIASRYGIRGIPTMILFHHGKEVARQVGALRGAHQITDWLNSVTK